MTADPNDSNAEELFEQLRNWQQQQHQRLLEQQQQQRKLLADQQNKLMVMLNSSDSPADSPEEHVHSADSASTPLISVTANEIEDVQNQNFKGYTKNSLDEIPLKKPRSVKTFNQLLETSLTKNDQVENTKENPTHTRKFPFLKRGQGISRFGPALKKPLKKTGNPGHKKPGKATGKENRPIMEPKEEDELKKRNIESVAKDISGEMPVRPSGPSIQAVSRPPKESSTGLLDPTTSTQKLASYQQETENDIDLSVDDEAKEGKSGHEEEDLAVFELLERFATINASFSSTSSFIGQLLEKGVTQLPSPSKVINFLSKKQEVHNQVIGEGACYRSKSLKSTKHVRFAENLEDSTSPWLDPILPTEMHQQPQVEPQSSPYVSNTCSSQPTFTSAQQRFNRALELDEPPASPIGFPDLKQLFDDPLPRPWLDEERPFGRTSPPLDEEPRLRSAMNAKEFKDLAPEKALPIEDPQLVYQSSLLRSRLLSLEREIAHYRRENDTMRRTRKELEDSKLKLEQEREKFRRYVENEKRRMQLLYSEEQKRIRAEQLKDVANSKANPSEDSLREELKQVKEDYRLKESKWMASQTKLQDKVRLLELRNRDLVNDMEKVRQQEQNLRRRLNASLRPGAMIKSFKANPSIGDKDIDSPDEHRSQPPIALAEATGFPQGSPADPSLGSPLAAVTNATPKSVGEIPAASPSSPELAASPAVTQTVLPDGSKLVLYPNGNRKEIWPGGKGTQVIYYNGDIKQKLADGSVVYIYADTGTKHTTKLDGTEVLEFTSGQIETTYPDGRSQVQYASGASKTKYMDGREEAHWPDGTKLWTDGKGHGVMTFPSGMREIYTPICKRREYPDGTTKTVYEDGRSETRYGNGRIRVKDSAGNIVTDTGEVPSLKP